MTVIDQDITIICGNDYEILCTLYEGGSGTVPLDLTGVTEIDYIARTQPTDGFAAVITKGLGSGIEFSGPQTGGLVTLRFLDTDTLPLLGDRLIGEFPHEMRVTDAIGNLSSVFQGTLHIRPTVAA